MFGQFEKNREMFVGSVANCVSYFCELSCILNSFFC